MDVFGSTLGGEAGDMALKFMPRGGVYIMGKIPADNVQVMASRRVKTLASGEKMRLGFMAGECVVFYFSFYRMTEYSSNLMLLLKGIIFRSLSDFIPPDLVLFSLYSMTEYLYNIMILFNDYFLIVHTTAFLDKGRMARVLEELPVKIVLANDLGQRGTHLTALRLAYDAEPVDDSWMDHH
mgnify:FL=1